MRVMNNVVINNIVIKENYKYLWLKYVTGADLSRHCARSLIGAYDKTINQDRREYADLILEDAPFYYLCGVKKYNTNLHLAFYKKIGENIEIDNEYYSLHISNAKQINIVPSYIDHNKKESLLGEYNTCRNWWFANWVAKQGR